MNSSTMERQQLIEAVSDLPEEVLVELAVLLDYLRYKTLEKEETKSNQSNFLAAITGLGRSGYQDISEREEEILRTETDPVHGWDNRLSGQALPDSIKIGASANASFCH